MDGNGFSGLEKRFFDIFLWIEWSPELEIRLSAFTFAFAFKIITEGKKWIIEYMEVKFREGMVLFIFIPFLR